VLAFAITQLELTRDSTRSCAGRECPNDHGIDSPAFLMVYTADRAAIGKAMAGCFTDDDFSIVGGAGAQPYYARMRGIDIYGLVSDRIAHEEPRSNARAGHTKWGSNPLLAGYDPDFVFSCYQIHATPKPPALPCDTGFWFARGFEQVTIHVPDMVQKGTYYTFLVKKDRHLECPGLAR
jgi:arabinofuranosyltransferase